VDVLAVGNEEEAGRERTFLLGYDGQGFEVRDVNYRGSILALPTACFLWKPKKIEEITPESLAPLLIVKPAIEILIIGTGEEVVGRALALTTLKFLAANGVAVEHMDTTSACSTFNILNQEDRRVAAALLAVDAAAEESES
jgi:NADH dehydrogenase [ubiquinone] 1 alpha subcomplex assembly factor 3